MKLHRLLAILTLAAALFAASGAFAPLWGFAHAEEASAPVGNSAVLGGPRQTLRAGELRVVNLNDGPLTFDFTPPSGSVYDFCAFPVGTAGADVRMALRQNGATLATGTGGLTVLSERLTAEAAYTLAVSGAGRVRLEIARHALSRCFAEPLPLEAAGDSYAKAIARAGDVHWYSVTAAERLPLLLTGVPGEEGLRLSAQLFGESGELLAEATPTAGGAFLLDFLPRPGRAYRVRVSAPEGGTGMYALNFAPSVGGLPEAVVLSENSLILNGRESRVISADVSPAGASTALYWESSDSDVVRVEGDGTVTGRQPGIAVVTAYAAGAVQARCRVEVRRVPVAGVELLAREIDVNVGDDVALEWRLSPENASSPQVSFEVSPEGVAQVDRGGVLRALGEGEALVTVRTGEGDFTDAAVVRVGPALKRYRALLIGEQGYASTVASVRLGSANSVAALRSMLSALSFSGTRYEITTRLDVSRDGALKAVSEAFGGATAQDVSLIYITCHGYYAGGMTYFQMYDGSVLAAEELRQALSAVPGEIVLLADCCGSGGIIGKAGTPADILRGVREVFGGVLGPSLFAGSRFRVLASAAAEQDSYRISFSENASESAVATAFARAVCEGGGWNMERGVRAAMRADVNLDGMVTLDELFQYVSRRVTQLLSLGDGDYAQIVQVSPEGDVGSLFERAAE